MVSDLMTQTGELNNYLNFCKIQTLPNRVNLLHFFQNLKSEKNEVNLFFGQVNIFVNLLKYFRKCLLRLFKGC